MEKLVRPRWSGIKTQFRAFLKRDYKRWEEVIRRPASRGR